MATPALRPARRALGLLRRRLRSSLADLDHKARLSRLARGRSPDYRAYLHGQLERTLSKRTNDPGVGARVLVDRAARAAPPSADASVLCVGCRNLVELGEFSRRGYGEVVGIDLFSQSPEILVMDMHDLAFPDKRFDVVYASHSLEHAYDLERVMSEISRVGRTGAVLAVEVPVRHKGSDADLVEFAGLGDLRRALEPFGRVLWEDEQPARSPTNEQGSAVARMVIALGKEAIRGEAPRP
jgi:SAM-dependent methyltransferase